MQPATYNIKNKKGIRLYRRLSWKDSTGTVVNLSGYAAVLSVAYPNNGRRLALLNNADGLVLNGTPFNIVINDVNNLLGVIEPGSYVFSLTLTSPGGLDYNLLSGVYVVTDSFTNG